MYGDRWYMRQCGQPTFWGTTLDNNNIYFEQFQQSDKFLTSQVLNIATSNTCIVMEARNPQQPLISGRENNERLDWTYMAHIAPSSSLFPLMTGGGQLSRGHMIVTTDRGSSSFPK
ncbi:hypothetical protein PoB_005013900 [Plakobranchus ocellatus]|uniref:Uncharacterized protein n=1 Tax=Plakobranchus ocellatus TaxID=259542 RepID=A0AAV4BXU1_9GAST|nr:hypothetical protein PoB_005013900 [Plakobranchus ocellatus]